jgi:RNA polymerase sigma factor (sigma-70 family)
MKTMEATLERSEPASTGELLESLHAEAWGWALACCGRDRAAAEDALQSAYARVLAGEARFDGRSSFKTWLYAVIRTTAAGERRRAWLSARGLARLTRLRVEPAPVRGPEAETAESFRAKALAEALSRLSRRQREVLHLVFYQGLTIVEAAGVLDLSIGSARVHYERGKARLRRILVPEVHR